MQDKKLEELILDNNKIEEDNDYPLDEGSDYFSISVDDTDIYDI